MKQLVDSMNGVWVTPWDVFNPLNEEFSLNVDVSASAENTKCTEYFDEQMDGLAQDWSGKRCWMNPPYGHSINKWIKKAATSNADVCVCLLPARTDTKWFHEYIYGKAEIRFIKGRIKFSGMKGGGMFPSMVVVFKN